jgi:hypothetical protein
VSGRTHMRVRAPDRIIGEKYLHRWHLIPRNPYFNVMLHKFIGSDDDRALHDHPWVSLSFLLKGELIEVLQSDWGNQKWRYIKRFRPVFRRAVHAHRLILIEGPAWTLFITGPVIRSWGFHCPNKWVHWRDFTDSTGNGIGRGCE